MITVNLSFSLSVPQQWVSLRHRWIAFSENFDIFTGSNVDDDIFVLCYCWKVLLTSSSGLVHRSDWM